jgi:hypothetical protein
VTAFYGRDFPDVIDPDELLLAPPDDGSPLDDQTHEVEAQAAFHRAVAGEVRRLEIRETAARMRRTQHIEPPPPPVLLSDFLAEPAAGAQYRVDRLWPAGGRVVLSAQRKAGKSTLAGNLLRCLVDGEAFLGEFATHPIEGRVCNLDFELDRNTLRRWMADHDIHQSDRVVIDPLRGRASAFDLLDPQRRRWWAERLKRLEVSVLVVDCLRPILDALGLDESHDAGRFLVALDELLAAAGIGECLVVHHAGHNGERARGDSRLRDWPDAEWRLVRENAERPGEEPPPDARRFFAAEGRDVGVGETALDYEHRTRRLVLAEGNRNDARRKRAADGALPAVIQALREAGEPLTSNAVAQKVGGKKQAATDALKTAVERGLVVTEKGPRNAVLHTLREVQGAE